MKINILLEKISYFISPENLLLQFLVILGILVTLISISTALSKEVRYKFIWKYFFKEKYLRTYFLSFISLFLLTLITYIIKKELLNLGGLIIFSTLFIWTTCIILIFIRNLNRGHFYSLIIKKLKKEIKDKNPDSSKLPPSLRDFQSNMFYAVKNNNLLDEEEIALRKIITIGMKHNRLDFVRTLLTSTRKIDVNIFDNLVEVIYPLKFKNSDINKDAIFQQLLFEITRISFNQYKEFDVTLNTSGLYLRGFLGIKHIKEFEESEDKAFIEKFKILANNTIEFLYQLNRTIMDGKMTSEIKYEYLYSQISELNKSLEHIDHLRETDFISNYYDLKFKTQLTDEEEKKMKLVELKLNIINTLKEELAKKQLILFYFILLNVDKSNLNPSFFKIACNFFKIEGFQKKFYSCDFIDEISFMEYDSFVGGAQTLPRFPVDRYRLLFIFHLYLKSKESLGGHLEKFEKEVFSGEPSFIEKELDEFKAPFVKKYFNDFDESELDKFKSTSGKEINKIKKAIESDRKKTIAESPAKPEYKSSFKKDCLSEWKKGQAELTHFLKIENVDIFDNQDTFFGRYTLYPKIWFIDSYEKNVSMARTSGFDMGDNQAGNKRRKVFELIFEKSKKIESKTLSKFEDIKKMLKPSIKDYYLIYGKNFNIYTIKNLDWTREGGEIARYKIGNSTIHFIFGNTDENILFEKNAFILKQNKKGFKNYRSPLFVELKDTFSRKELDDIKSSPENKYETDEDVKQNVKIRIAEKFSIEKDFTKETYKIVM